MATLTTAARQSIGRRSSALKLVLLRAERDGDESGLNVLLGAAISERSHEAMNLCLGIWEAMPAEERAQIEARAEKNNRPEEMAKEIETDRLERIIADLPARIAQNCVRAKGVRLKALLKAYRAELRRRRNPNMHLVWANDEAEPRRRPNGGGGDPDGSIAMMVRILGGRSD